MIEPKSFDDLSRLLSDGVEEDQQLEYKAAQALEGDDVQKEIGKDVSAMANALGGTIIYGIGQFTEKDKRHLPKEIVPVDRTHFSRERLEQIINSNISPRIDRVSVQSVAVDSKHAVYVVQVPQSTTAHQNAKDCIYYKRYNTEVLAMKDFEVRDIMNRLVHPKIEMQFELQKQIRIIRAMPQMDWRGQPQGEKPSDAVLPSLTLRMWPSNVGSKYAKYINYFIDLPKAILDNSAPIYVSPISETVVRLYGDNTVQDVVKSSPPFPYSTGGPTEYGPSRYDPLLPGLRGRSKKIRLDPSIALGDQELLWDVHADNAPISHGSIRLSDIRIVEKEPVHE